MYCRKNTSGTYIRASSAAPSVYNSATPMFATPSSLTTGLHSLSHVMQSLLMRLQADIFLMEKSHAGDEHPKIRAQYTLRSKKTIKQLSVLLEQLFQCLYLANETYKPELIAVPAREWNKSVETELCMIAPQLKVHSSISHKQLILDSPLTLWMLSMMVYAALQWMRDSAHVKLRLFTSSPDRVIAELTFIPATDEEGSSLQDERPEHAPIASFYWSAAELAAEQLGAQLSSQTTAQRGHIQASFMVSTV